MNSYAEKYISFMFKTGKYQRIKCDRCGWKQTIYVLRGDSADAAAKRHYEIRHKIEDEYG